uniref:UPAR/Ly6 domain-containing protein n=1 Tax=Scleropages formosus TaxID=113540 RepID=A0A8C9TC70_SCLFO
MPRQLLLLILLGHLPTAAALRCYTCVFPAISPIDCLKFPQECPAGQRCLSSVAIGTQGTLRLVLYEKSCAFASQCGLSGDKSAAGLNFTYTNECCDADLCNGAIGSAPPRRPGFPLPFLLAPALALAAC